jgi:polyisoprenoid-binding protein YceI
MTKPDFMQTLLTLRTTFFALFMAVLFTACGDIGDAPQAQTGEAVEVAGGGGETLAIDTSRSEINWKAAKVTRAHDGGFRDFTGTVTVAGEEVTGVDLTIDTRSIWSDSDRLTNHLKSEDFFQVETYPTATFEAAQIVPVDSAGATHLITGNLTMHGKTNSVTFPATITTTGGTVNATADFIIDRTQWDILYTGKADDLIENNVRLLLDVTAATEQPVASAADAESGATE